MCDTDLSGDDLKVVQYSIVNVDPYLDDDERILFGPALISTSDDMTGEDFASWVIARWCQNEGRRFPDRHKKYIRVCYCVQCRLAVPSQDYEKDQVETLKDINRTLKEQNVQQRRGSETTSSGED